MCVNYNNGKIYKIVPKCGDDIAYIGSTTRERLCQRMEQHRSAYFRYKKNTQKKVSSYDLFDKYGIENCEIILLELVNCNSKDELHIRERYWIECSNCVNKNIVGRTFKEWYADNRDSIMKKQSEYREHNRDSINQKQSEHREHNRDSYNQKQRERYHLNKRSVRQLREKN